MLINSLKDTPIEGVEVPLDPLLLPLALEVVQQGTFSMQ